MDKCKKVIVPQPVWLVFLLALAFRLAHLGSQSLWLDEGSTWQTIQQGWDTLLGELFNPVSAYPIYHVLLKAWVALAGDSEWALRLPSALAGAGAVAAIFIVPSDMCETQRVNTQHATHRKCSDLGSGVLGAQPSYPPRSVRNARAPRCLPANVNTYATYPIVAAVLLLCSPFALWYAQEAKVYSLFLLMSTLILWSVLRLFHEQTRRNWMIFLSVAVISLFVHRLAILQLMACFAAFLFQQPRAKATYHWLIFFGLSVAIVVSMVFGLGDEGASTGAHIPASPQLALWLTFVRFSVDRGPGDVPWWWLVPWAVLMLWGIICLGRAAPHSLHARFLLCFLIVPTTLFLIQLIFTRFYETRYLMQIYPAWILVLAYPAFSVTERARCPRSQGYAPTQGFFLTGYFAIYWLTIVAALLTNSAMLTQPGKGLFSGAAVKEQFREVFAELAKRVHPDDVIVLHPPYMEPLYHYYMQRFTTDPVPQPAIFSAFKQGQKTFSRRDWDAARKERLAGHVRSFLVIAPEHARTVDIPNAFYQDEYGVVGIYYQYSREEKKWPCGIWRFNGAHMFCQESPEAYETGEVALPQTPMHVTFGEHLQLLGYTLKATMTEGAGLYRAGGSIPLSLFWDVTQPIGKNYSLFLHLCQDCTLPPLASDDGQPLGGYLPTSTWLPKKPARDDRAVPLPRDLPPGEYTLLLGLYIPENPTPEARIPIVGGSVLDNHRLILQKIIIR